MTETKTKAIKEKNGTTTTTINVDVTKEDNEFVMRESTLKVLLNTSAHIRSIYHIMIVILLLLFCDVTIHDLLKDGKINVGQQTILNVIGDVRRVAPLWLYLLVVATTFYPLLRIYAAVGKTVTNKSGLRRIWSVVGWSGLAGVQVTLMAVPLWDLSREHLSFVSSMIVTSEMFRFFMKIYAAAMGCKSRCFDNTTPMPTLWQYLYFLFAPTLLYRDQYPRTKKVRWSVAMYHFAEVAAILFYYSFLWERFVLPFWSDFGKTPRMEAATVVRAIFTCLFPGVISIFIGFYCVLHAWLNAFAEMMTFGDRLFYEEWWTQSSFGSYYRQWNRVVHLWFRDLLYRPLIPVVGRGTSMTFVFFVSAAAHEVLLAVSLGFFYPVQLIVYGVIGRIMVPVSANISKKYPNGFNFFLLISLFVGHGMFWSVYTMEYFARQNCPPSEYDSFFIPKSWSCPKIILKTNQSF